MPCSSSNPDSSWANPGLVLAVTYIPAVTLRFCEDDVKMTDVSPVIVCNRVTWHPWSGVTLRPHERTSSKFQSLLLIRSVTGAPNYRWMQCWDPPMTQYGQWRSLTSGFWRFAVGRHVPLKPWYVSTKLHGITSRKTIGTKMETDLSDGLSDWQIGRLTGWLAYDWQTRFNWLIGRLADWLVGWLMIDRPDLTDWLGDW